MFFFWTIFQVEQDGDKEYENPKNIHTKQTVKQNQAKNEKGKNKIKQNTIFINNKNKLISKIKTKNLIKDS